MDQRGNRPTFMSLAWFRRGVASGSLTELARNTGAHGVVPAQTHRARDGSPGGSFMDRPLARRILLAALAVGLLAEVAIDGPAIGLNAPILAAATLAAAWLLRRRGRAPDPLDAWLPVAATVLAGFVAVRADPFVAFLDLVGAIAFTGASMAAFSGLAVTRRSVTAVIATCAWVLEAVIAGTGRALRVDRPTPNEGPRQRPVWLGPVARGLVLAVPLMLIFAVLFASADPIFNRGFEDLLNLRIDLGDLPGRVIFVLAIAWLAGGLLSVAATGLPAMERTSLGAATRSATIGAGRALGTTEAIVVLVAIDLVVGLFVALQLAYLFGGLDTLDAAGMKYSDYARRGYFELVAAAALAGGVLVALEYEVTRRSRAYIALALGLVGLTIVVLASAALRLRLYQDAYGWTELRLYVAVSIGAMAVTLVALAVFLATDRTRWLGHAMAVIGLVSLIALNLIAPAAFVAERNLARVIDPSLVPPDGEISLDSDYLAVLPDDAVPALKAALPALPDDVAARVRGLLERRKLELANEPALRSPFAWNLGRERAKVALGTLP
jgi:hypothetical protein